MFKNLFYKQCYVSGIHPACPKCKTRIDVYMLCECGCKYKYHIGL